MRFTRHIREYFLFVVLLVGITSLSSLMLLHRVRGQEDSAEVRKLNLAIDQLRVEWVRANPDARASLALDRLAAERGIDRLEFAVRSKDEDGKTRWHYHGNAAPIPRVTQWDSITVAPPNFPVTGWQQEHEYVRTVTRAEVWGDQSVVIHASSVSPQLGALDRLMQSETWLRGIVLAAFGLFSILFYRLVLLPFRDMRHRAAALAQSGVLPDDLGSAIEDPEYVIATFDLLLHRLSDHADSLRKQVVKSERRARELERFNEYMLASLSTGVVIVGPDGDILRLNRSAEKILQVSGSYVVGRQFDDAGLYPEMIAVIEEGLRDGYVYSRREVRLERPAGDGPRYLGINTSRILNEHDEVIGLSVLLTDLTEIKSLYDELAENQRLADLGEMAAGLAHQLRNSMAAILGYGKLLRQTVTVDSTKADWVDSILAETDETSQMLTRFLDFARPLNHDQVSLDVVEVILEAADAMRDLADQSDVRLTLQAARECQGASVNGDSILLKQVFINLIQNAIEAMPQGGEVSIGVRLRDPGTGDRQQFWIGFSDTGGGIPGEIQSRVFQPFFTSKETGTGLGLPLAKKIAIVHGGNLVLEHSSGSGTTFVVLLPAEIPASAGARESASHVPATRDKSPAFRH